MLTRPTLLLQQSNRPTQFSMKQSTTLITPGCVAVMSPLSYCSETYSNISIPALESETDSDHRDSDTDSEYSDSESSDMPMSFLLQQLSQTTQDLLFQENGLKEIKAIKSTAQGEIFHAITSKTDTCAIPTVQIKKVDKHSHERKESLEDEDHMQFVCDDDIIKEKTILDYLTDKNAPNHSMRQSISKPHSFFESVSDYYLVTELPTQSLKEFVTKALMFIKSGKLKAKSYRKLVKQIFFQISAIINWLHLDMRCCHLNLSIDNITLENAEFIQDSNGSVSVSPEISVKLTDFGQSEIFTNDSGFSCDKFSYEQSVENGYYLSPNRINEMTFDARSADLYALGMIIYECVFGEPLYSADDIAAAAADINGVHNGYWAVMSGSVLQYVGVNGLLNSNKIANKAILSVINQLLQVSEDQRMNCEQLLHSKWMSKLYNTASEEIQSIGSDNERETMSNFPFYQCYKYM